MIRIPQRMAAGIGSLPYKETKPAIDLILKHLPLMPHWPQLPLLNQGEGFIEQFTTPLVDLGLMEKRIGKNPVFIADQEDWTDKLTAFYQYYITAVDGDERAMDFFALRPEQAVGFYDFLQFMDESVLGGTQYIKGQISGPLTVGLQLTDEQGRPAYYNHQLKDLVVKGLAIQAKWQTERLKKLGLPVVIFIDDPRIYACGLSTHITLNKEEIMEDLNTIVQAIHHGGGAAGIHLCAGADWSIILESEADIMSFDAYGYYHTLVGYTAEINSFLERGGVIAWGIVPTAQENLVEDGESLRQSWRNQLNQLVAKGVKKSQLFNQWLVTPSCGTGLLPVDTAEAIYLLTEQLAKDMREGRI